MLKNKLRLQVLNLLTNVKGKFNQNCLTYSNSRKKIFYKEIILQTNSELLFNMNLKKRWSNLTLLNHHMALPTRGSKLIIVNWLIVLSLYVRYSKFVCKVVVCSCFQKCYIRYQTKILFYIVILMIYLSLLELPNITSKVRCTSTTLAFVSIMFLRSFCHFY